jgi:hypothetical protein
VDRDILGRAILALADRAGAGNDSDIEAALLLVARGLALPTDVRRRLVNLAADAVAFAEWMEDRPAQTR